MSLQTTALINCDNCNHKQEIDIYSSVNITIDPSLKQKVIDGNLNEKECEQCKQPISVISGFLYHDMLNKLLFSLNLSEKETEIVNNPFSEQPGYIYREVSSYSDLLEKINIFDYQLNDIVINEIIEDLELTIAESIPERDFKIYFEEIKKGFFKKELIFTGVVYQNQIMKLKISLKKITKEQMERLYNTNSLRN